MNSLRIVVIFVLATLGPSVAASQSPPEPTKKAIVEAIEDEIYDYKLQQSFRSIGRPLDKDKFEIPLYLLMESHGSSYYVIYKLMPYGELYRQLTIGDDGLAHLFRNPRSGFPPDSPAMQTAYLQDEKVCKSKHDAVHLYFVIEINPTLDRIRHAIERQKKRYGFSNLEETKIPQKHSRK